MNIISTLIDFILHIDQHLQFIVTQYGIWIYVILFALIFCETGLVVTPFLPGDSLLFAAGGIAAIGEMNVHFMVVLLLAAAIIGDAVNFSIGKNLVPICLQTLIQKYSNKFIYTKHRNFMQSMAERRLSLPVLCQ